jgi:hypothetical protein
MIICVLAFCAGCSSTSGGRGQEQSYANAAKYQSLDAYQICTEDNPGDPEKCAALVKLLEDDKKRLDRVSTPK